MVKNWLRILQVNHAPLKGINIPKDLVPLAIDEFPIIFIAAACAKGQTLLHGAKSYAVKKVIELALMVEGLQNLGIEAEAFEDGLSIKGGNYAVEK